MLRSIFIFIIALSSMAEASFFLMRGAMNARRLSSFRAQFRNANQRAQKRVLERAARDATILNACPDLGTLLQTHVISDAAEKKILAIMAQHRRELGEDADCLSSRRLEKVKEETISKRY